MRPVLLATIALLALHTGAGAAGLGHGLRVAMPVAAAGAAPPPATPVQSTVEPVR